jgi:hypothetical protein
MIDCPFAVADVMGRLMQEEEQQQLAHPPPIQLPRFQHLAEINFRRAAGVSQ